jgi:hypothetical protein
VSRAGPGTARRSTRRFLTRALSRKQETGFDAAAVSAPPRRRLNARPCGRGAKRSGDGSGSHPTFPESKMKKSIVAASTLALALMGGVMSTPARADSGDIYFEMIFAMADKNKDTMVTRAEFLDAMGRAYDMKMTAYKKAGDSGKMMKGDAMTKDGLKLLIADVYKGS